ncbi:hypothetical protein F4679DRAFT_583881 [Xylaria curta]|nr:hypothetical protein F4679DRAFT_583881 [Xylaria curta]
MGRLVKIHLARLITLTAAWCKSYPVALRRWPHSLTSKDQLAAAIQGFFWPKALWDFLTKSLNILVEPVPILQLTNLLCAVAVLGLEWPWRPLARTPLHESVCFHIFASVLSLFPAVILYQGTNAALYYAVGAAVFAWGYASGEKSIEPIPWTKRAPPRADLPGLSRGQL